VGSQTQAVDEVAREQAISRTDRPHRLRGGLGHKQNTKLAIVVTVKL